MAKINMRKIIIIIFTAILFSSCSSSYKSLNNKANSPFINLFINQVQISKLSYVSGIYRQEFKKFPKDSSELISFYKTTIIDDSLSVDLVFNKIQVQNINEIQQKILYELNSYSINKSEIKNPKGELLLNYISKDSTLLVNGKQNIVEYENNEEKEVKFSVKINLTKSQNQKQSKENQNYNYIYSN